MASRGAKLRRTYRYQNYAKFYGIPCYYGEYEGEHFLRGRNLLYDWMIPLAAWLHNFFCMVGEVVFPEWEPEGFPVQIGDDLPADLAKELDEDHDVYA